MNTMQEFGHAHALYGLNTVWEEVLHLGVKKTVPKGVFINCANKNVFCYIKKGQLRLSSISTLGAERIVYTLGAGCICAEVNIFHHYIDLYSPGFYVLEDAEVYLFPKELLQDEKFIKQNPKLFINLLQSMSFKIGAIFSQVSENASLDLREQFARLVLREYEKHKVNTFSFGYSQIELSLIFSVHRNSIHNIIRQLRDEGVIGKCTKNCIEILDLAKIVELAKL